MASSYDILVIGGGPGGYVAAIRAAQLGLKTAIVEREHLGGICLNWGCIPTKALLRSAEIYSTIGHAEEFGLTVDRFDFDITKVIQRSRGVSGRLNAGVEFLMKKNKIDVIWGEATLSEPGSVVVTTPEKPAMQPQHAIPKNVLGNGTYSARHIIVATGARPRALPGMEPDGDLIWSYFDALVPKKMPKSLVVMGSGAIGIEFASFYRSMGAEVTVVELMPHVMPAEDTEISAFAQKQFEKQGMKILLETKVVQVDKGADEVSIEIETKDGKRQTLVADRLISAVGVVANSQGLGLEQTGVELDRDIIAVDAFGATSVKGVYAIGDVAGAPMLAHKAEHDGVICVEKIAGQSPHVMDKDKIPACTYCVPQVASVGMTEQAARQAGKDVKIGRFNFSGNGKAVAMGETDGLVKTIFDAQTGQLLGAHLIGSEVTEMVQGFVVAMNLETTEQELIDSVFPHPTISETMQESVLSAEGRALHS